VCLADDRVADFISRLTLDEKCAQTDDKMGAVSRLGWAGLVPADTVWYGLTHAFPVFDFLSDTTGTPRF
jgi:hypothetical protein